MKNSRRKKIRKEMISAAVTTAILTGMMSNFSFAQEMTATGSDAAESYQVTDSGYGFWVVTQDGGETLSYSSDSGVTLLEQDGYLFKDLNRNGSVDTYEDWKETDEVRAESLAAQLMSDGEEGIHTALGLLYHPSAQMKTEITQEDGAYDYIVNQKIRHILSNYTEGNDPEFIARANNAGQALAGAQPYGIPVNYSSDPRHGASGEQQIWSAGQGGDISKWPDNLGLAATFDPSIGKEFGKIASSELRALGIGTSLSPQVDLATEPRWSRVSGTFGENAALSSDFSKNVIDGMQSTYLEDGTSIGWGEDSAICIMKHFPGGGVGEGGRDAHMDFGKYGVYPGDNLQEQLEPFKSAMELEDGTSQPAGMMPYYSIMYDQDPSGENLGNAFSNYIITDLLKEELGFDGLVCTDWGVSVDGWSTGFLAGAPWGVEDITDCERIATAWEAGTHQIGIYNETEVTLDTLIGAYEVLIEDLGEEAANEIIQNAAEKTILNMMRIDLFDNPYVNPESAAEEVGNAEYMEAGYEAQVKSVVMLKNSGNLIQQTDQSAQKKTVYVSGISEEAVSQYYTVTEDPDSADFAIVKINTPSTGYNSGYDRETEEYLPITLQYGEYTADEAREESIAADPGKEYVDSNTGEILYTDTAENRSYKGKTTTASNIEELETLQNVSEQMGEKPVIVYVNEKNPLVFTEVEPLADAIVVGFGISDQAVMEIISGTTEPSGLLPIQQPANMETVEQQQEDVGQDMECYVDEDGNVYDFGFGLNWSGKIQDERTEKYVTQS